MPANLRTYPVKIYGLLLLLVPLSGCIEPNLYFAVANHTDEWVSGELSYTFMQEGKAVKEGEVSFRVAPEGYERILTVQDMGDGKGNLSVRARLMNGTVVDYSYPGWNAFDFPNGSLLRFWPDRVEVLGIVH